MPLPFMTCSQASAHAVLSSLAIVHTPVWWRGSTAAVKVQKQQSRRSSINERAAGVVVRGAVIAMDARALRFSALQSAGEVQGEV